MIYLRKLLDMFFLSMLPSLASFLLMSYHMSYTVWYTTCIFSTVVFFAGNLLLMRRFVRDIKDPKKYYAVWLTTFVVYTALGAAFLLANYMYPFTWIFFHSRITEILTMGTGTPIKTWLSFACSMAAFLAMILIAKPVFSSLYQKEKDKKAHDERKAYHLARNENDRYDKQRTHSSSTYNSELHSSQSESSSSSHHKRERIKYRVYEDDDNTAYSARQLRKLEKLENNPKKARKKQIGSQKAAGQKSKKRIKDFFLNLGSYSFYQSLAEKVSNGADPKPIIKSYIKRKMHLGTKAPRRK